MTTIRASVAGQTLTQHVQQFGDAALAVTAAAVEGATVGATTDLRQQLRDAFPRARRMATIVTGKFYPARDGKPPVGWIHPRDGFANKILSGQRGGTIVATRAGTALAIPTRHVPEKPGGGKMSPDEVSRSFGERLTLIPARPGARNLGALVLRNKAIGRSGRVRDLTPGRRRQGRVAKTVVMFVLVAQVRMPTRWNPDPVLEQWVDLMPRLADRAARTLGLGR